MTVSQTVDSRIADSGQLFRKHPQLSARLGPLEGARADVCQVRDEENVNFSIGPRVETG